MTKLFKAAVLLTFALVNQAQAETFTMKFTVSDFDYAYPALPPEDPVTGTIVWDALSIHDPIKSILSIELTVAGYVYSKKQVGSVRDGSGDWDVIGCLNGGLQIVAPGTDDFWISWDCDTLTPREFVYTSSSVYGLWEGESSRFTSFSITNGPPEQSPVGTWEVTISGGNRGVTFITFNDDSTLDGYGMTLESFGMFTIDGTWSLDLNGIVSGTYTQHLDGQGLGCTFTGKARLGTMLQAKVVAGDAKFTLKGVPPSTLPVATGFWYAHVTQGGITSPESIELLSSGDHLGKFDISGTWPGLGGPFIISGQAIMTSKGRFVMYSERDSSYDSSLIRHSLFGKLDPRKQRGSLQGLTGYGQRLKAKLTR